MFNINCPHCSQQLEAEEQWIGMSLQCPVCKNNVTVSQNQPQAPSLQVASTQPVANASMSSSNGSSFYIVEPGVACVAGEYNTIFSMVKQAVLESGLEISEDNISQGVIKGECKYCRQWLFINVLICNKDAKIFIQIDSQLKGAGPFGDVFDGGPRRIKQIFNRLNLMINGAPLQEEANSRNLALVGYWLSVVSIFIFGFLAVFGIIISLVALNIISGTHNKEGRKAAFAGLILGAFALVGWIFVLILFLNR